MSASPSPAPPAQPHPERGGIYAALRYTGIPQSWIKRPKLPSRNWLIFLGVTQSLIAAYVYDRRQCKRIRQTYVERVGHLAQQPMASTDLPRKVTVYTAKWPGDDDYNRPLKYFRKYVKPIFVAAAVDYEVVSGRRHGALARDVADRIKSRRRLELGLDTQRASPMPLLPSLDPAKKAERELKGGSVIIGRQTFKEYMFGLREGWTRSPDSQVDREEVVISELADDGNFDEPDDEPLFNPTGAEDEEPIPTASRLPPAVTTQNAKVFSPLTLPPPSTNNSPSSSREHTQASDIPPPSAIPPQPPLLLVPFTNYVGFTLIPLMIWDFFNERTKVKSGAESAYRLVMGQTRRIQGPLSGGSDDIWSSSTSSVSESSKADLDFDRVAEAYYKRSLSKLESEIAKEREAYYKELPKRLETARALSRGVRQPTKDEVNFPPPTEVELRAERLKKEMRWRGDTEGWTIVKPAAGVVWDDRFESSLTVFEDPFTDSI